MNFLKPTKTTLTAALACVPGAGICLHQSFGNNYGYNYLCSFSDGPGDLRDLGDGIVLRDIYRRGRQRYIDGFSDVHQHHDLQRKPQSWNGIRCERDDPQNDWAELSAAQLHAVFEFVTHHELGPDDRDRYRGRNGQWRSAGADCLWHDPCFAIRDAGILRRHDHSDGDLLADCNSEWSCCS
jgi:hypothetical protein